VAAAIADLRGLRQKIRFSSGETVKDLIDQGRRD
jgi:hypothetical protein